MHVYYKTKQKIIKYIEYLYFLLILFHIMNTLMSRDRHCTWSVIDTGWHRRQVL